MAWQQARYCALRPQATVRGVRGIYVVTRRLGSGGQVYAWLGKSIMSGEDVVIREPRPDLDPNAYMLQLNRLKEAYFILWKIYEASALRSPGSNMYLYFERVLDYQDTGICYYMVTKYVSGRVMDESMTCYRSASSSELCRRNVAALLRAVGFMHSVGIIHRDIKPRNVIEAPWGPVLIDFTTAKYFYRITLNDVYVRSPGGYTAPEQENSRVVSTQSDVWSVGATLLKVVTGQHPVRLIRPGKPLSPSLLAREFAADPGVANFIAAALDPDPSRRPATLKEMEELMLGETVEVAGPEVVVLGRRYSLAGSRLVVGRAAEADLRIGPAIDPLQYVSSHHALLEFRPGEGWVLRDLCSTNGTAYWRPGMSGWRVLFPGRKRQPGCAPGRPAGVEAKLGDTALIALGYHDVLGPYMVLVFRGAEFVMPSAA